jgi:hypothetical protein
VIVGATALKGVRLRRRGVEPGLRGAMAAGVAASFGSTLASQKLISLVERDRALWPYAAYRVALATAVLLKLRRERRRRGAGSQPGAFAPSSDGAGRARVVESTP